MGDVIKLLLMVGAVVGFIFCFLSGWFDIMRRMNVITAIGLTIAFFSFWLFIYSSGVDNKDKKDAYEKVSACGLVVCVICLLFSSLG